MVNNTMENNAMENTRLFLKKTYGDILPYHFTFTNILTEAYDYLINKYTLSNDEKIILHYILNNDYTLFSFKNIKSFELVLSMYNAKDLSRAIELLFCLSVNLQNQYISKIHILYETSKIESENINFITETIYLLQHKLKLNIVMDYNYNRHSFRYIFNYINSHIKGNVIITNTDIIYDYTLNKITNIDDDTLLCISRKNKKITNNNVTWDTIKLNLPSKYSQNIDNSFSHDTWIFTSPMKYTIYIDINLGQMFCDSYLNYKLSNSKYKCYNLANDIKCYHIQESDSYSDIVSNDPKLTQDLMEQLIYRENGNKDCICALMISDIQSFYNKTNFNDFYKHSDFIRRFVEPTA